MKNFAYFRPATAEQAVGLLDPAWGTTELLAGGTDLVSRQKEYVAQPDAVISLTGLGADLAKIEETKGGLRLGALATITAIAESPLVRKTFPFLAEAAGDVGGPQIRNMGTLGGNLCQRNRCWYYHDEAVKCLLKGGDKCYALDGENRHHAVFTKGHPCVIVHPSTLAPVLIALDAEAEILGPKGKRTLKLAKFFHAPTSVKEREHVLAPNEMVLAVRIPTPPHLRGASYEVRHKQAYDWPLAHAAVSLIPDGDKATKVKIVLGHVAPTPLVAASAAKAVEGKAITEESAAAAGEAATEGAKPLAQNAYKVRLIAVAVKRALLIATGKKKYWEV